MDGVDLLLTDVMIPGGMSGPTLATEATARQSDIKVVYMSGYEPESLRQQDQRDSKTPLLRKPFRKLELARVVHTALNA